MFEMKNRYTSSLKEESGSPEHGLVHDVAPAYGDTSNDLSDMHRLGKKQEFQVSSHIPLHFCLLLTIVQRNFGLISTLGFISIYMATWEFVLVSLSAGLSNGGYGGLFWVFIGTVLCYATVVASLAEMESMAPTSGGQYHW